MEFLEVDDNEDERLMPSHSKEYPGQGVKPTHLDPDSDSGHGSYDSHSLLSEKCEEPLPSWRYRRKREDAAWLLLGLWDPAGSELVWNHTSQGGQILT